MNKRIHTILLASALLCASGCSEFLDVDATDAYVTEENISTVEDIDMLVTGTYGSLMENGLYGEMIYLINDVRSDNGFPNQNTFTANLYRLEIEDFAETTLNTGIIQFWQQHWRAVGRCNFALEMARKIDPSVKGNERVTEYIGEAKFLRALYMFNLVRTFGRIPVVTAYCRDVLDAREHRPRSSTEIYDQILRDLTDAEDCLDVTESESGRAGSGAVLALKGKVYLTMAGYPYNDRTLNPDGLDAGECYRLALANLNRLTEPGTVYDYALMPSYYDLFDPAKENRDPQNRTNPEDIFSVQFKSGTGIGLGSPYPRAFGEYEYSFQIPNGGKASCVPHADLLDAFVYTPKQDNLNGVVLADPAAPRDARGMAVPAAQGGTAYGLGCTVTGTVRGYGGNGLYMTGKYLTMKTSSTIADDADNNFYVLRLGDVILMQAEALWELGRHAEAVDKLNEIVDRANATLEDPAQRIMRYSLTPGDGSGRYPGDFRVIPTDDAWAARKMILDERRRELAFEGQRWFDLVRCNRYRDSLKMCLTPDDIAYLYVVTDQLIAEREYEAALSMLLKKYADPEVSVHEKAILAYSLGIAYRGIGDLENAERYLTISAINDLSTPIKEYQSLQELAFLLYNSGDIERAYNYINYAINDAIKFNIGKHFPFILRVLPTIVHSYEQKMKDKERQQTVMLWCIAVLLLFLCVGLVTIYAQKREIAKANRRQAAANRNLVSLNENLRRVNMQQSEMNEKLVESNRLKEVYVGYYMDICSDCIDSANRYRVSLNRIARNRGTKALLEELQTGSIIDDRIQAFYDDFDAAFLHIFPHFVEQFNELIVPEKRKFPKPGKLLNTELRVFALIRLGITDSNKIAKFLRYSVSTIYNCRVRMRNAAIDSRDNFEQQVMRLGLPTEEPPVRA